MENMVDAFKEVIKCRECGREYGKGKRRVPFILEDGKLPICYPCQDGLTAVNCTTCYGKGYTTYASGAVASADMDGRDQMISKYKPRIIFCRCERGVTLKNLVEENYQIKKDGHPII